VLAGVWWVSWRLSMVNCKCASATTKMVLRLAMRHTKKQSPGQLE